MSFLSGHLQSLFEDSVIVSDAKIQSYVEEINKLKPQKGHDNCGNSTYKAGKENTSRHLTQDETGLGSALCRHGVVLVTANLKSGENYRVVNFFQHFLWTLGYVYFCYDVICNYDLVKVSEGHEMHVEWMRMSKEMTGFFQFHGRTHTWNCQVDNNGRWRDWACASLGEEQEQVFARFARDGLVTKHMSPASIKEDETLKKLAVQLSRQGLTEQDLPDEANPEDFKNQGKEVACEEEALVTTGKNKDKILPNSYKVDHEGQFMIAAWARKMMNKYGDTTSERDKFRFKMQEANGKATALMLLINEQSQFKITQEMYETGSFPWNETTENIHSRLQDDIGIHTAIVDGWQDSSLHQDSSYPEWIQVSRGKLVLINAELDRLKWKVGRAIKLFRRYTYGDPDEQEYDCDSQHCDFDTDSSSQYHSDSSSDE
ncbi:hypothetical protein OUZ56_023787 [Daphnia magna]|uniref:Uncharacterized protein n=1 Tax=Daphnia magna TaxID=35525 RepID=A0ABR0AZI3_9CRUS|nr:hypothetical protein OUZ56_023787 [Daphnia magna]